MAEARTHQLTGVAGVHYVAAILAYRGFHAVPTTRNIAGPDLLVSTLDGSRGFLFKLRRRLGLCARVGGGRRSFQITMSGISGGVLRGPIIPIYSSPWST